MHLVTHIQTSLGQKMASQQTSLMSLVPCFIWLMYRGKMQDHTDVQLAMDMEMMLLVLAKLELNVSNIEIIYLV